VVFTLTLTEYNGVGFPLSKTTQYKLTSVSEIRGDDWDDFPDHEDVAGFLEYIQECFNYGFPYDEGYDEYGFHNHEGGEFESRWEWRN
jgi:hypothetical protein